jgi:hypothetical protein
LQRNLRARIPAERHGDCASRQLLLAARLAWSVLIASESRPCLSFDAFSFDEPAATPGQVRDRSSLENAWRYCPRSTPARRTDQSGTDDQRRRAIDDNSHGELREVARGARTSAGSLGCEGLAR